MSKSLDAFFQKAQAIKNASNKFTTSASEGGRIIPSPTKDADFQLRIDAGHYDSATKRLNVVLQVNNEAKSPGLRDWTKRHTTHERLATASFDTGASDRKAEYERVLANLKNQAKQNIGK